MKIVTIIPTFNRQKELRNLLWMLGRMNMPEACDLEIITVVDGSSDGTLEMLETEFPDVHVVAGDGNWWYTKSINEGFKYAGTLDPDLILTLNDDIILKSDYLEHLVKAYREKSPDSIIGSISFTHNSPHRVTNSGVRKRNRLLDMSQSYFPFLSDIDPTRVSGTFQTPVLPGRGMLIPWHIARYLGFFDEHFVQYQSDFDFTLRARKEGFPVYISWDAKVFSILEKTSSGSSFLKSSWKTLFKNFFNRYSRSYLPNRGLYYWRHYFKLFWPLYMLKFVMLSIKHHVFKKKMEVTTWEKNSSLSRNYFQATEDQSLTDSV